MKRTLAHVGLGSNLDDSAGYVREGIGALERVGRVVAVSDLYVTAPWGNVDQPSFINAAVAVETALPAPSLVKELLAIERDYGRVRDARYGPRTLDLDVLLYGDLVLDDPACTVPHPQLMQRAFALAPLAEIAANAPIPGTVETIREALNALPAEERAGVRRLLGTAHLGSPERLDYDACGGAGDGYADLRPFSAFDTLVLDAALAVLEPLDGKRLLDVGCGTGRFTRELSSRGAIVTGFDPSETMLAAARATHFSDAGIPPAYVRGDANVALTDGVYDAVTAFYSLQYLDVGAFCERAFTALAPAGNLVLASFPHRHFAESEFARFFPSMAAIDIARFPSRQQLEKLLAAAGFTSVRTRSIVHELSEPAQQIIAKVERKYLSSFHLLSEHELREGIAAMRAAWSHGDPVRRTARSIVVSGSRPG